VLLGACYSALQSWFVRKKQFSLIARSRVGQSVGGAGTQVGLGFGGVAPLGLFVGSIMNTSVACIVLGYNLLRAESRLLKTISWLRMKVMAVSYHRFPKYSSLEALSNCAALQVPIVMIAAMPVGPEAGYLTMAMYVMQAPMALVGTAIGQVYLSRAAGEYRADKLGDFTADIFAGLLKVGVGPLLFAGIVSPVAFVIVFVEAWIRAGQLVVWMTPWFIMQFIASSISMALHVSGNQRTALSLQIFGLIIRVTAVWVAETVALNWVSEAYAISGFVFYSVYLVVVLRAVSVRSDQILRGIVKSFPHALTWAVIAVGVAIGLNIALKYIR
jgi:O-antigen/teichoic acid export membrane protein